MAEKSYLKYLTEEERVALLQQPTQAQPQTQAAPPAAAPSAPAQSQSYVDALANPQPIPGAEVMSGGNVVDDVVAGISEAPKAVLSGAAKAVNETMDAIQSAGDWLNENVADMSDVGAVEVDRLPTADLESNTGRFIEGASQFITGMVGVGKFTKAAGLSKLGVKTLGDGTATKIAGTMAKGAVTDALVFDPHEDRLSNLIEQYEPLNNPVSRYLAARDDDSEAEGRFKAALEGLVVGPLADALMFSVKALKLGKAGKLEAAEEAAEKADVAFKEAEAKGFSIDTLEKELGGKWGEPINREAPDQGELALEGGGVKPDASINPTTVKAGVDDPSAATEPLRQSDQVVPVGAVLEKAKVKFTPDQEAQLRLLVSREHLRPEGIDLNFELIRSTDDAKAFMNAISALYKDEITKMKGGNADGVRSWDNVRRNAERIGDLIGEQPGVMLQRMQQQTNNLLHLDAEMRAYETFVVSLAERVHKLAEAMDSGLPGPFGSYQRNQEAFIRDVALLANVQAMYKSMQTNVARSLNAMKIGAKASNDMLQGLDLDALRADPKAAAKLAKRIRLAGPEPKATIRTIGSTWGEKLWGVHNEYWINSILSGVKTQAVNFASNTANLIYQPAERMFAGAITLNKPMFLEGARQYRGIMAGLNDSLELAWKALKTGENILDPAQSTVEHVRHNISAANFGLEDTTIGGLVDALGTVIRLPTRLMSSQDELFKQLAYRGRAFAMAAREADNLGFKSGTPAWDRHVKKRVEEAFTPDGMAKNDTALLQAQEVTFTQDLGYGIGHDLQRFVGHHPGMRVILPFIRTPTNILRFTWQRTPGLNLLQKQWREDFMAGGERRAMAVAKATIGGALWAYAANLAMEGRITGGGPTDPDLKKAKMETGWRPYSFVWQDENGKTQYTELNRLDPFGMFFGIAADMTEVMGHISDGDAGELVAGAATALINNLSSKTYLRGIMDTAMVVRDPIRSGQRWMYRQVGSYVPSVLKGFNDDPHLREVRSSIDAIKARLPGYSKEVDPRRNILGEKVLVPPGMSVEGMSPLATTEWKADSVLDELADQMQKHNRAIGMPSPKINGSDIDLREVKLENGYSAYDRLLELRGTVKIGGYTLRDRLEQVINSDRYRNKLTDGDINHDGSRLMTLTAVIGEYGKVAEHQLLREQPELKQKVMDFQRQKLLTARFGAQQ
ncbi:MAG: hypothetical protein ACK4FJ_18575 [Ferrovibrio sp.]|uniref:hypothetical protein n=1 Tax=Ferrovibrio sp. TaxID=1917215 RepID=UPI00391DCDD2